jgi:hypothetical protein
MTSSDIRPLLLEVWGRQTCQNADDWDEVLKRLLARNDSDRTSYKERVDQAAVQLAEAFSAATPPATTMIRCLFRWLFPPRRRSAGPSGGSAHSYSSGNSPADDAVVVMAALQVINAAQQDHHHHQAATPDTSSPTHHDAGSGAATHGHVDAGSHGGCSGGGSSAGHF